jgi:hypothetical protein
MLRVALPEQTVALFELFSAQCAAEFPRMTNERGQHLCANAWQTAATIVAQHWTCMANSSCVRISDVAVATAVHLDPILSSLFPTARWAQAWFEKPFVATGVSLQPLLSATTDGCHSPHLASVLCCICSARCGEDYVLGVAAVASFVRSILVDDNVDDLESRAHRQGEAICFCLDFLLSAAQMHTHEVKEIVGKLALLILGNATVVQGRAPAVRDAILPRVVRALFRCAVLPCGPEEAASVVASCMMRMEGPAELAWCIGDAVALLSRQLGDAAVYDLLLRALPLCSLPSVPPGDQLRIAEALYGVLHLLHRFRDLKAAAEEFLFAVLCGPLLRSGNCEASPHFFVAESCWALTPVLCDVEAIGRLLASFSDAMPSLIESFLVRLVQRAEWTMARPATELPTANTPLEEAVTLVLSAATFTFALLPSPVNHVTYSHARTAGQRSLAKLRKLGSFLITVLVKSTLSQGRKDIGTVQNVVAMSCVAQLGRTAGGAQPPVVPTKQHELWRWLLFAVCCDSANRSSGLDLAAAALEFTANLDAAKGCDPVTVCQTLVRRMSSAAAALEGPLSSCTSFPEAVVRVAAAGFDLENENDAVRCAEWMALMSESVGGIQLEAKRKIIEEIASAMWQEILHW